MTIRTDQSVFDVHYSYLHPPDKWRKEPYRVSGREVVVCCSLIRAAEVVMNLADEVELHQVVRRGNRAIIDGETP